MRNPEHIFKEAVTLCVEMGLYPSPDILNQWIHNKKSNNLNGRECLWRREICHELGFKLKGFNLYDDRTNN